MKSYPIKFKDAKILFKASYLPTYRCRKMLYFLVRSIDRIHAVIAARKKIKRLTEGSGIFINVFKKEERK